MHMPCSAALTLCSATERGRELSLPNCLLAARQHGAVLALCESDMHALLLCRRSPCCCAGVMDAVANGYLKNMYFGIASDAAATNLLEVSWACAGGTAVCPLSDPGSCCGRQLPQCAAAAASSHTRP